MDKQIKITPTAISQMPLPSPTGPKATGAFKKVLETYAQKEKVAPAKTSSAAVNVASHPTQLFIGTISEAHPTVSEVLLNNKELREKGWNIIFSEENSSKPYTQIPTGTPIYFDPESEELTWPTLSQNSNSPTEPSNVSRPPFPQAQYTEAPAFNAMQAVVKPQFLVLGELNSSVPTVSHLLDATTEYSRDKWNILAAPINQEKNFNEIPPNAIIQIDTKTHEISWNGGGISQISETAQKNRSKTSHFFEDKLQAMSTAAQLHPTSHPPMNETLLGVITPENPTVSHLLSKLPKYKEQTWGLLAEQVNQGKLFDSIPAGTHIFINNNSHEISWKNSKNVAHNTFSSTLHPPTGLAPNLTEAVQPYIGTSYDEIDCYDLLVRGLRKMGIPYMGKDGLRNMLTRMAEEKGLPANAYMNGEGIVQATGSQVFTHSANRVNNWAQESAKIFKEMQNHLEKGQILSFSTPTRGHTGIVSQHNNQWTFINSGRMDNQVNKPTRPEGVGEEKLLSEIENWFKVAKRNEESLVITLGKLEEAKIRSAFFMEGITLSQKM